jgi:hypothetical protein
LTSAGVTRNAALAPLLALVMRTSRETGCCA